MNAYSIRVRNLQPRGRRAERIQIAFRQAARADGATLRGGRDHSAPVSVVGQTLECTGAALS